VDSDVDEAENLAKEKQRGKIKGATVVVVVFVATVVALWIFLTRDRGEDDEPVTTNETMPSYMNETIVPSYTNETIVPSTTDETMPSMNKTIRTLIRMIKPIVKGGRKALLGSGPRGQAFEYIVENLPKDSSPELQELLETYHGKLYDLRQWFVLVLLYFSTTGNEWVSQAGFLSDGAPCSWFSEPTENNDDGDMNTKRRGVSCDNFGKVKAIHLPWNNLVGTLPPELAFFNTSLVELVLPGGSLGGSIPGPFRNFQKLETLVLDNNCLTGRIPRIQVLKHLKIHYNAGVFGNLNRFCNETNTIEGFSVPTADCSNDYDNINSIECDCCICCNPDVFECNSPGTGATYFSIDGIPSASSSSNSTMSSLEENLFRLDKKKCLSVAQEEWIREETPESVSSESRPEPVEP